VGRLLGINLKDVDEDCLTLNVWTPSLTGRRPVMVWLHGGAWLIGGAAQPVYDGGKLVRRGDVVVVTVNYRLGALGFLRGADVCGEELPTTGNEGIGDCVAALAWVRREVAAFGGDPENITVFGESAGAVITAALLVSPTARGLFHKAIIQSGPLTLCGTREQMNAQCARFVEASLGQALPAGPAAPPGGTVAKLRARHWREILDAQNRSIVPGALASYGPVLDGTVIPDDPHRALAAGAAAGIPVLIGTNAEEMKLYGLLDPAAKTLDEAALGARVGAVAALASTDPDQLIGVYRGTLAARGLSVTPSELWFAINTDFVFRNGSIRIAELQARHAPVYSYLFTRRSPAFEGVIGAAHGTDLPYVFGNLDDPDMGHLVKHDLTAEWLSRTMQEAWVAFARTGNPSTAGLAWPQYEEATRWTAVLGDECRAEADPMGVERRAWRT
jgi:para-nitrobenzyl esterase